MRELGQGTMGCAVEGAHSCDEGVMRGFVRGTGLGKENFLGLTVGPNSLGAQTGLAEIDGISSVTEGLVSVSGVKDTARGSRDSKTENRLRSAIRGSKGITEEERGKSKTGEIKDGLTCS